MSGGPGGSSFSDHFSDRAQDYARFRPGYPANVARRLAKLAPGRELAWDAGCGSGQLSILLAGFFRRVVATDASGAQLARAPSHPGIEYRKEPAERSTLPDTSVDLAVAAQAAHWFDLDAYYGEVRRVVRPAGVVALLTYGPPEIEGPAGEVLGRFRTDVLDAQWPQERRHVETGYASLPFPFSPLESGEPAGRPWQADGGTTWAFSMAVSRSAEEFLGYLETWSAVRVLRKAGGEGSLGRFRSELASTWGLGRRPVTWRLVARVGRI